MPGSDLGPLFHTILVEQFTRLRDGDRFFYLNYEFTAAELALIGAGDTLAEVIKANTTITNLQDDVFRFLAQEDGQGEGLLHQQERPGGADRVRRTARRSRARSHRPASSPRWPTQRLDPATRSSWTPAATTCPRPRSQSYTNLKSFLQNANGQHGQQAVDPAADDGVQRPPRQGRCRRRPSTCPRSRPAGSEDELTATQQQSLMDNGVTDPSGIANDSGHPGRRDRVAAARPRHRRRRARTAFPAGAQGLPRRHQHQPGHLHPAVG